MLVTDFTARLCRPVKETSGFRVIRGVRPVREAPFDKVHGVQWVLVREFPELHVPDTRPFDPFAVEKYSGLFRTFAGLDSSDPEALAKFASECGCLKGGREFKLDSSDPEALAKFASEFGSRKGERRFQATSTPGTVVGEADWEWAFAIHRMARAVRIGDMIRDRDWKGLGRYFKAEDEETWVFDSDPDRKPGVPTPRFHLRQPVVGKWVLRARGKDEQMRAVAGTWLFNQVSGSIGPLHPVLMHDPERGTVMRLSVPTLMAALWLQVADAIEKGKEFQRCKVCPNWFQINPESDRPKLFCSDACKSRDYRLQKLAKPTRRTRGSKSN